ncbi:MAG: CHAT domain-containing protein [Planctomycetales bacterium]|nr:CHAT domain-containing protein [Planctomycetales bacterium]
MPLQIRRSTATRPLFYGVLWGLLFAGFTPIPGQAQDVAAFQEGYRQWTQLEAKGAWQEAAEAAKQTNELVRSLFGEQSLHTARVESERAELLRKLCRYPEALELAHASSRTRASQLQRGDPLIAESMLRLARLHIETREFPQAFSYLSRGKAIVEARFGKRAPQTAEFVSLTARVHAEQKSNLADAETMARLALEMLRENNLQAAPAFAEARVNLAYVLLRRGEFSMAAEELKTAIGALEQRLGAKHPTALIAKYGLALCYSEAQQFERSKQLLTELEADFAAHHAKDSLWLSFVINDLGSSAVRGGDFPRAVERYERSYAMKRKVLGEGNLELSVALSNLCVVYGALGQNEKAVAYGAQAMELILAKEGKTSTRLINVYPNLGSALVKTGRVKEGVALILGGAQNSIDGLGETHPDSLASIHNAGVVLNAVGRPDLAEALINKSARAIEVKYGRSHPVFPQMLASLGTIRSMHGFHKVAANDYLVASLAAEQTLGKLHPKVAGYQASRAVALARTGDLDEAVRTMNISRVNNRRYVETVLPWLTEGAQLAFLKEADHAAFHHAMFIANKAKRQEGRVQGANWVINGKGLSAEVLGRRVQAARSSSSPEVAKIQGELSQVRQELAQLALAETEGGEAPKDGVAKEDFESGRAKQINRFLAAVDRQSELDRQLAALVGAPSRRFDPWVSVDELRTAIPPGAVLVEIVRVPPPHDQLRLDSLLGNSYMAWTIPAAGEGEVGFFYLGLGNVIEPLVVEFRRQLGMTAGAIKDSNEVDAERKLHETTERLSQQILHPLLAKIGQSKRWIISPDAALWMVPWEALRLPGNERYAVEEHEISYTVCGREWTQQRESHPALAPMMVADPDYNLGAPGTLDPEKAPFKSLSGTAREGEAVAPLLTRIAQAPPIVRTGEEATEEAVRQTTNPEVLLLSTHGFFEPGDPDVPSNPMLRCGLALAGANYRPLAKAGHDGILTGMEIMEMDLRGTKLVVLSACETGAGDIRIGEGVAGLRHAFHLAGAQSVVSTLWPIPDLETADFMTSFFRHLSEGKRHAAALRAAQIDAIEQRRKEHGGAHPIYWAAFTLSGSQSDDQAKGLRLARHHWRNDRWDEALWWLGVGQPRLAPLVKQDLLRPAEAKQQLALGKAWLEALKSLGDADAASIEKEIVRERMLFWNRTALVSLPDDPRAELVASVRKSTGLWLETESRKLNHPPRPPKLTLYNPGQTIGNRKRTSASSDSSASSGANASTDEVAGLEPPPTPVHSSDKLVELTGVTRDCRDAAMAFSPDRRWLARGGVKDGVSLVDLETGKAKRESGPTFVVHCLAFSPDGKRLVAAGENLRVFDVESFTAIGNDLASECQSASAIAFSHDSRLLAVAHQGRECFIEVWDVNARELVRKIELEAPTFTLVFGPRDQAIMGTVINSSSVSRWSVASGAREQQYPANSTGPIALLDDETLVVSGSNGITTLKLKDGSIASQQNWGSFAKTTMSSNGRLIACANVKDEMLEIWGGQPAQRITTVPLAGAIVSMSLSGDGQSLGIVLKKDRQLWMEVWRLQPKELLAKAAANTSANLARQDSLQPGGHSPAPVQPAPDDPPVPDRDAADYFRRFGGGVHTTPLGLVVVISKPVITDEDLELLKKLSPSQLTLFPRQAISADLSKLKHLEKLTALTLFSDLFDAKSIAQLNGVAIDRLYIQSGKVDGEALKHLASMPNLEHLTIVGQTRLQDEDLRPLEDAKKLKYLTITGAPNITEDAMKRFKEKSIQIQVYKSR